MVSRCIGTVFGGSVLELTGIVIRKRVQEKDIGKILLNTQLETTQPTFVTAHTRNPGLLKVVSAACGGDQLVYPLIRNPRLHEIALAIPNSSEESGIAYHIDRYGPTGLYGEEDQAERPSGAYESLKLRFPGLENIGTALVVVAKPTYKEESR